MSFYFSKTTIAANAALAGQWESVSGLRSQFNAAQLAMAGLQHISQGQRAANEAAVLPRDAWREMDAQTKSIMVSDEGGPLMADLMALAKPVGIGKIVVDYRRRSDSGAAQASISGQLAKGLDKGVYDYDGTLVLVHDSSFGREWREVEGHRSEGFDGLADDQSNAARAVMRSFASHIVNGVTGVKFKSREAKGLKTSTNVASIDLTIDYTSTSRTYAEFEALFIAVLQQQQATNFVRTPLTFYVSSAIWFNLLRRGSADAAFETFLAGLSRLPGVAAIKQINDTTLLSGNEFFAIPLTTEHIQPIVGMAATTTPVQRMHPFEDFNFVQWGAVGIQIKADYNGKKGCVWAREIP